MAWTNITKKATILVVVLVIIIGSIVFLESMKVRQPPAETKDGIFKASPELRSIQGWINTEPFTLEELRGNVILIDFWTYSCINCIRTLPFLTAWDRKYRDQGLIIVGVHTPEFKFEEEIANVQTAVDNNNIEYRVALDNDYSTWRAFNNRYWPRKYLIDIDGFIRYDHIGEGAYENTEAVIQALLQEKFDREEGGKIEKSFVDIEAEKAGLFTTPELYFGFEFKRKEFGNDQTLFMGSSATYTLKEGQKLKADTIYLQGEWRIESDHMELLSDVGSVFLQYTGKKVNIVAGGGHIGILVDSSVITDAGDDVVNGTVSAEEFKLYNVVAHDETEQHLLEIEATKGFRIYTFTFG